MKWKKIVKEGIDPKNPAIIRSKRGHATFLRTQLADKMALLPGVISVDSEDDKTLIVVYKDGGQCYVTITEG